MKKSRQERGKSGEKRRRALKMLLIALIAILLAAGAGIAALIVAVDRAQLDVSKFTNLEQTLVIYDRNGDEYARLDGGEDRVTCALTSLSETTKNAFLAAEDLRFYSHRGVDVKRMFGALFANVKSGGYAEGASTITQQLVKLTQLSSAKTLQRKAREIVLALKTERLFTKDEILEMYLNTIYFGGGYYGVEAASLGYFGHSASELDAAEAATLAAVIKAPALYAPDIDPTRAARAGI